MNAIIIARVSTEEQKEAGNSLPAQAARLEKYCQNRNYKIIQNFSFDESAYKNQREEFDRILDFLIEYNEKVIVCFDKVDRLSRNIFDKRISILYDKALTDQIELHFVSEGQMVNSRISAAEKFHFGISLGLAKYYSDAIGDNVRRAFEQKLRRGECLCKAPFGYKNIKLPDDKTDVIVDDYNAHIVRKAFELYSTGAYSFTVLVNRLNKDYRLNWSTSHVNALFKNHFYYGQMKVKGNFYPHRYPPLISKDLFDRVQSIKQSFRKQQFKYAGKPYIYRGLLRCAQCGLTITPEKHKGHVYYHCTQYNGKHDAKWFREETITEKIGSIFKRLQLPPEIIEQIIGTLKEVHEQKVAFQHKQFDQLTREQKNLTKMLDALYFDKLKGSITESEYDRYYQSLRNQIADITATLEQLQDAEDNYYITTKYILDLTSRAYKLFLSSEVEEKRQLIKLVLSNLRIDGENIVYDAHKPFDLLLNCSDYTGWRP